MENVIIKTVMDIEKINEIKEKFSAIGCAQLNDASQEFTFPVKQGLINRTPHLKLCGPVYPVNTENDMLPGLEALNKAPEGSIILINNISLQSEALIGDIFVVEAIRRNMGGLIVNGAIRDMDDINNLGMPVFSSEITFISAKTAVSPAKKVPDIVNIEGLAIEPGDWIFGDNDGLLLIKPKYLNAVLQGALYVDKREKDLKNLIINGNSLAELSGLEDYLEGKGPLKFEV